MDDIECPRCNAARLSPCLDRGYRPPRYATEPCRVRRLLWWERAGLWDPAPAREPKVTVYNKPISWGGDYSGEWS